ncbi:MAG: hypothetical protein F6J95_030105 [Leptolyngbya sp. SIO1E4]|nr:hypothetical protein [Leptolyngbya sp. SIO1E4]
MSYLVISVDGPPIPLTPLVGQHVAFAALDRSVVDRFYQAGLEAGGKDNGPPGLHPHYHPNYYAAFLINSDGHHIEVVCQTPEKVSS